MRFPYKDSCLKWRVQSLHCVTLHAWHFVSILTRYSITKNRSNEFALIWRFWLKWKATQIKVLHNLEDPDLSMQPYNYSTIAFQFRSTILKVHIPIMPKWYKNLGFNFNTNPPLTSHPQGSIRQALRLQGETHFWRHAKLTVYSLQDQRVWWTRKLSLEIPIIRRFIK